MRRIFFSSVLGGLLATLVGCSGEGEGLTLDAGPPAPDAGLPAMDAGLPASDAGGRADAAVPADAGARMDAGEVADAAVAADAGAGEGPVDLAAWFRDYNARRDQSYLSAGFTTTPEGDARYAGAAPHAHHAEVPYGPFERNVLDFWQVDAAAPTPVLVYIHGGGFQSGSKESVHRSGGGIIREALAAGVSVASISYRYAYRDHEAAVNAPVPNDEGSIHDVNGTRLDYILRDCARAIQFIRHQAAAWNVDPTRIGAIGGSAGAGCATWTGAVPDLAVPGHPDPVLRQSTRLTVVGHTNGQPTYDFDRWPALLEMDPDFVFGHIETEAVRLSQATLEDLRTTAAGRQLRAVLDYYAWMGPGDADFITVNANPDADESEIRSRGAVIHHPRGHVALYRRCQQAGLRCEIDTQIERSAYRGSATAFMIEALLR